MCGLAVDVLRLDQETSDEGGEEGDGEDGGHTSRQHQPLLQLGTLAPERWPTKKDHYNIGALVMTKQ